MDKASNSGELSLDLFKHIGRNEEESETLSRESLTYWKDAFRRLRQNKIAMGSLIFLIGLLLMCAVYPELSPYEYDTQIIERTNEAPSAEHIFGLDDLGRDVFTRIWIGGRISLMIGFIGTAVSLVVGTLYGGISGYIGGKVDEVMMRIVEILVGIPYMIVVILVSMRLGKGMHSLIIALCIASWTGLARIVRGQIIKLKESEYVLAAKALGVSPFKIIMRHLVPNTLSLIIVNTTFSIPGFIFAEAFLSFIGLGIQPPYTSWGAMASAGQQQMMYYPHQLVFPALAICMTMLAFNLLGDGLRDAVDPKLRR